LKGGEILHFRQIVITGLMVGAALFLPDNAFAERNELGSQKSSVQGNSSVKSDHVPEQANVPTQAEKVNSMDQPVVVPEPASKRQDGLIPQPSQNILPAAAQKPAPMPQNMPDQAKGKEQSELKKSVKAKALGTENAAIVQANNQGLGKNKPTLKNDPNRNLASESLHNPNTVVVKNKAESARLVSESQGEGSYLSVSKQEDRSEPLVPEQKEPANQEEIPDVSQAVNTSQRGTSSGGQSNDRISSGLSTISLNDKWFEWNRFFETKLTQSYLSRHLLMNNQWVNAPPAPPPQKAPFLKTVTRSY
jgi:hypothetical protein